jgi:hypothetical protein
LINDRKNVIDSEIIIQKTLNPNRRKVKLKLYSLIVKKDDKEEDYIKKSFKFRETNINLKEKFENNVIRLETKIKCR